MLRKKHNSKWQGVRPRGSTNGNLVHETHTTSTFHRCFPIACGWIPCLETIHLVVVTFVHVYFYNTTCIYTCKRLRFKLRVQI